MSTLLFLHGVGGGRAAWDRQIPYFSSLGHRAHAWDQPGYGGTSLIDPYDLEQIAGALRRLIESRVQISSVLPAKSKIKSSHDRLGFFVV